MFENVWIEESRRHREAVACAGRRAAARTWSDLDGIAAALIAGVAVGVGWGIPGLVIVAGGAAVLALRETARRRRRPLLARRAAGREAFRWSSASTCR